MTLAKVLVLLGAFLALHQDFWLWGDGRLVLGFLPAGLAYHVAYSVATAGLWWIVLRWAWPDDLEPARDSTAPDGNLS